MQHLANLDILNLSFGIFNSNNESVTRKATTLAISTVLLIVLFLLIFGSNHASATKDFCIEFILRIGNANS